MLEIKYFISQGLTEFNSSYFAFWPPTQAKCSNAFSYDPTLAARRRDYLNLMENGKSFNPNIAGTFFRVGYVEAWGRGIEKMCESKKNKNITQWELAEVLNVSRTTLQAYLKELVDIGVIQRAGGKRYGYWEIKN